MRAAFCASLFLATTLALFAAPSATPEARPRFRPAVLGTGADSLVNRIDVSALLKKGQKAGAVMFCATVSKTGEVTNGWTYRAMPDSTALDEEVTRCLEGLKVAPAIYEHQPVGVLLEGTVIFSETKPHVRIVLNQDPREIKEASDFIAPQPVYGGDSSFDGLHAAVGTTVKMLAIVDLRVRLDAGGKPEDIHVLAEDPPLLGFGNSAIEDLRGAKFIPAFRDGDATSCDIQMPICYRPNESGNEEQQ